ncbi:unnamed protein product [Aphis gossypii]|uniref:Uncharacterized protein n=1 Tax=Aphis gossypii TaxID=80765 RepID=A0A9P0NPH2_APHGO|nr:unnamed protein product [Aphis gossypii]
MYSEGMAQELQETVSCQKEKISKLKKKVAEFDSVVSERNDLKKIYNQFEQNNEDSNNESYKKSFNELLAKCDIQSEKLKEAVDKEHQWILKYERLDDVNSDLNCKLITLKSNENKLQSMLEEIETTLKCVQSELCTTQSELEEKNCIVNKLKKNLKCNEQELINVRKDLEWCKNDCKDLNEKNGALNVDLKFIEKSLCDTKLSATRMEKKFTQEREHLSNELKKSCKKFNDLELIYDEVISKLNDEKCKSKKLGLKLIELNKVSAKNHLEMKTRIQKLQEEICAKNNDLCSLKKKVTELQQENECKCTEISELKNKISERECQLKQMSLLTETIEQIKSTVCCPKKCETSPCCPKKKCETTPCCPKKKCEITPCCPKK